MFPAEKIHRAQLFQAAELLTRIEEGRLPADKQMELYFREHRNMGSRDRGFVAETVYGCLRRKRLLEVLVDGVAAEHPWAQRMVAAYLLSTAGWSGRALTEKGFAAATDALVGQVRSLIRSELPFAVRANLPDWLAERLLAQYGEDEAWRLAEALNQPATLDLRVNTLKADRDAVAERLAAEGYPAEPTPYSPWGLRRAARAPLFRTASFRDGWYEVQDEGSQLISLLVEPQRREMVVDFCAGAGGKTLHLATLMENAGSVHALDISESRLRNLRPRLQRADLHNVRSMAIKSETDARLKSLVGRADRVLVDAPCSGTGTLRRNPDIKWRDVDLTELSQIQGSVLQAASRLVKPGGRLVYATCSLLREENEAVVEAFLERQDNFEQLPVAPILAAHNITVPDVDINLRLLPHRHNTDGFFAAVLQRRL